MYGLELAWRLETSRAGMRYLYALDEGDVMALDERVIAARVRLDALTRKVENQESP